MVLTSTSEENKRAVDDKKVYYFEAYAYALEVDIHNDITGVGESSSLDEDNGEFIGRRTSPVPQVRRRTKHKRMQRTRQTH